MFDTMAAIIPCMSDARHHLHLRKRLYALHQTYPHPNRFKNIMDRLIYIAAIATPLMTVPQAYTIFAQRNASGLSAPTWIMYFIGASFWFTYGLAHKEKPIQYSNFFMMMVQAIIIAGIFLYR